MILDIAEPLPSCPRGHCCKAVATPQFCMVDRWNVTGTDDGRNYKNTEMKRWIMDHQSISQIDQIKRLAPIGLIAVCADVFLYTNALLKMWQMKPARLHTVWDVCCPLNCLRDFQSYESGSTQDREQEPPGWEKGKQRRPGRDGGLGPI